MKGRLMSNYLGCFVIYWPCGKCISGAALDDGSDDADTGLMLLSAVRDGCKTEWRPYNDMGKVSIAACGCSPHNTGTGQ